MQNPTPHAEDSAYQDKLAEYYTLTAKLRLPDTFKTPQERSEAVAKLKALRSDLNATYLKRHGLA